MDIDEFYTSETHEKGAEMQVMGQDGKLKECFITFLGRDSKKVREALREGERRVINGDMDVDDATAYAMSEAGIAWRGFTQGGKDVEFSNKALFELLKNAPYITDQADKFIGKRGNFIKK